MTTAAVQEADRSHLRLLVIFHYIVAGITALFSCMFILHIVMGIAFLAAPESLVSESGELPPPLFGWIFIAAGSFALLCGFSMAICLVLAARFLSRRTHHLFCLVIAGISCLFFPFGTVLGVFTLVILLRPSVKTVFATSLKHEKKKH
jgi:hypothetical protein